MPVLARELHKRICFTSVLNWPSATKLDETCRTKRLMVMMMNEMNHVPRSRDYYARSQSQPARARPYGGGRHNGVALNHSGQSTKRFTCTRCANGRVTSKVQNSKFQIQYIATKISKTRINWKMSMKLTIRGLFRSLNKNFRFK